MHKILVVEDESVIRAALRRLLERNGYHISEAGSVQEAEKEHNLSDFNLVISDLRLPGAPGTDLIQKAGDVPVLIMTSFVTWNNRFRTSSSGYRYFLQGSNSAQCAFQGRTKITRGSFVIVTG